MFSYRSILESAKVINFESKILPLTTFWCSTEQWDFGPETNARMRGGGWTKPLLLFTVIKSTLIYCKITTNRCRNTKKFFWLDIIQEVVIDVRWYFISQEAPFFSLFNDVNFNIQNKKKLKKNDNKKLLIYLEIH